MSAYHYVNWYPADYMRDTRHLTRDQHGAYFLLLNEIMLTGNPLPDNNKTLARIALCDTMAEWRDLRAILEPFFVVRDGKWYHKRAMAEIGLSKNRSEAGKKAAQTRHRNQVEKNGETLFESQDDDFSWMRNADSAGCDSARIVDANQNHNQSQSQNQNQNQNHNDNVKNDSRCTAQKTRGSRLENPFELPDEWARFAKGERPQFDPGVEAQKFADYWHGVPGAKGRKLDWYATWRNFVRSDMYGRGQKATVPSGKGRGIIDMQNEIRDHLRASSYG
jgi:uncharacterized protein YdaU (DUF1376 family)